MIDSITPSLASLTTQGTQPAQSTQTGSSSATSDSGRLSDNANINQQQFLLLFIAQLQHQDPLAPMEPNELTAQLAQFSSLEQLHGVNDRLDKLAGGAAETTRATMLGLLGRDVSVDGGTIALQGGKAPPADFTLDGSVQHVTAVVTDADGQVVSRSDLGNLAAGDHRFEFDGKSSSGTTLKDGTYQIQIFAQKPGDKTATAVSLATVGTVDGVDLSADPPTLDVAGRHVTIDQVKFVRATDA